MARKKVKLELIECESARRASLKKRRLGLMKKVNELTILCGLSAAVIVYSPDEVQPAVWPSHTTVLHQLARFRGISELERAKKMNNQETYLTDRLSKAVEQLMKKKRRNKEVEMGQLMHQINKGKGLDEFNLSELKGLNWLVEEKMKEIRRRIEFFHRVPYYAPRHAPPRPQGPAVDETTPLGSGSAGGLGGDLLDDCFIDTMNNNEHKSASNSSLRTDMDYFSYYHPFAGNAANDHLGLLRYSFGGSSSSSFPADMGMGLPHGNSIGPLTEMEHSPMIHASSIIDHMRQPLGESGGGSGNNFGSFGIGSDMGLGPNPFGGHIGSSSAGTEFVLPPLELSESSSERN